MNFRFSFVLFLGLLVSFSLLLQGCSGGGGGSTSGACTLGTGANVIVSGQITFDRVPHDASGLDYGSINSLAPARGVVVEAKCGTSTISSATTDASGHYSLSVPGSTSDMFVRVKAQMLQTGSPSWNFQVVDNTSSGALYSMDGSAFDSGASNSIRNLHAGSGWNAGALSYTSTRVAAPFAILDSVYKTIDKILIVDANTVFPDLNLNWSINNKSSVDRNVAVGDIVSSHYDGTSIYIQGLEDSDTDEYDEHVIVHEWGHYYEDKFSRSDSIGGRHNVGDYLDMRVAFSEGFGNAFSAIILDNQFYKDSGGSGQQGLFVSIDIDDNTCAPYPGWHNECSVQSIVYDIYDNPMGGDDDVLSMGFAPVHNALVLANRQITTDSLTSLFSFIHYLKTDNGPQAADIDTLVGAQNLIAITDIYGGSETVNNPGATDNLPVYSDITIAGAAVNVCSTGEFQGYNGVGVYRFLKFTAAGGAVTITANRTSGIASSDPDIELFYKGLRIGTAWSVAVNTETLNTVSLTNGEIYIIQINEDAYFDVDYSGSGETCFDVSVN